MPIWIYLHYTFILRSVVNSTKSYLCNSIKQIISSNSLKYFILFFVLFCFTFSSQWIYLSIVHSSSWLTKVQQYSMIDIWPDTLEEVPKFQALTFTFCWKDIDSFYIGIKLPDFMKYHTHNWVKFGDLFKANKREIDTSVLLELFGNIASHYTSLTIILIIYLTLVIVNQLHESV